ncbi:MAG TPA: GatB/YqeY domain-containing protein [Candidatus Absconditabacterales bacterium]|nr:GatB/YqeY domain-containing protein [Candidatus Absconditabacterales bacterium]HMT27283.1 GatB/YqeY domain-containing protein [Candidatus Absconditabacterales bacterium]
MTLEQTITEDYKTAFKEKNTIGKIILGIIIAQIKNKRIEIQKDLTDEDIIQLLKKEVKAMNEAITYLEKANNQEGIIEEQEKIKMLEKYLPAMLSLDQTKELVQQKITELGITDLKTQRGQLTQALMQTHKASLDGSTLNQVITSLLS